MNEVEAVRSSADPRLAAEWALVLESSGIPCAVSARGRSWVLEVPAEQLAAAAAVLEVYERETSPPPATPSSSPDHGPTPAAFIAAAMLLALYAALSTVAAGPRWYDQGTAYAVRILAGEWWRTITALTLHASLLHVLSNVVALAVFGTGLCRAVGPGVGLSMTLLAGAGGNALNALWRGSAHGAVGASTAVFGAVGALGALQFVRRRARPAARQPWLPVAAALGLLALLGTGTDTDVLAHLFGFIVGAGLGYLVPRWLPNPVGHGLQWALLAAASVAVAGCWMLALR
jgi:rhomboid protease GluP